MQGIAMFLCGAFSRLGLNASAANETAKAAHYGNAAASMIFLFTFVFGATWLTVPWLYPAEIFPLAVRAKGNAWGVVGWSIGNGWLVSGTLDRQRVSLTKMSDSATSCLLPTYRREDILSFRNREHVKHSFRLGSLPGIQSANA